MSRSAGHDQRNDALRQGFAKPWEFAASTPPTAEQIADTSKLLGLEHSIEEIPDSQARIHWLGDRKAGKTLLYFHGGGFGIAILEGHVKFLAQCIERLKTNDVAINVAVLEYSLTPSAQYPKQIIQASEALHFLLDNGHDASTIIIGGDSAGGNMTLALLSTISHGFEGVKPFKLDSKLAGALLICPWTSFSDASESWKENEAKDVISKITLQLLVDAYIQPKDHNNYSEPVRAGSEWWSNIAAQKTLNVYGGYEAFKDDQAQIGRALKEAGNSVEDVECDKQVHIDAILDAQSGMEAGEMSHAIWEWLAQTF